MFHLPRTALDALAYEAGVPRVRHLLSSLHSEPWRSPALILDQRPHRVPALRSNGDSSADRLVPKVFQMG